MRLRPLAIALFAVTSGLACALWESPLEPLPKLEIPTPEFRPSEADVAMLGGEEHGALWLATCPIASFYLFGAAELARDEGYASFGPAVAMAYRESQEVVEEIDFGSVAPAQAVSLMKRYGTLKAPTTLRTRVSHETWALLEEKFAQEGRSSATVRSLQPWLVSFALANRAPLRGDADPLPDIADRLHERAQRARGDPTKPVIGLRSLEAHFRMFAGLPRRVQDLLLRSALGGDEADALLWHSPELMPQIAAASAERARLYEHVIYRRSEQMAERLFQIGIDGKQRFVTVGILHLVGERGIPALLGQRGYRISRVQ
jgi:uncharacterized protein YbaP (TraB family)